MWEPEGRWGRLRRDNLECCLQVDIRTPRLTEGSQGPPGELSAVSKALAWTLESRGSLPRPRVRVSFLKMEGGQEWGRRAANRKETSEKADIELRSWN